MRHCRFDGMMVRTLAAVLSLAAMPGCYEVIPVKATQEMTIHKDGSVEISYVGEFVDLRHFVVAVEATKARNGAMETHPSPAEHQRFIEKISGIEGVREFQYLGADAYRLVYSARGNLKSDEIPEIIDANLGDSYKIPGFIQLSGDRNGERFITPDARNDKSRTEWEALSRENDSMGKEIRRLMRQLKGELKIRTDAYVESHNAASVQKLPNGMTEYRWSIHGDNIFNVRLALSLNKPNGGRFDPTRYPPGTDCIKTFGSECQCSFSLVEQNSAVPLAHRAYRIEMRRGKVIEGCSDAQGNTKVVTSRVTGSCKVIVLTESESNARCKGTK